MATQDLQSKFDELVSKYMTIKKQVFEDVMRDQSQRDKYYKYFGTSVSYDGAYWYVNNYGTAHKYIQGGEAWSKKSKLCPQKVTASLDLSDFPKGPNMMASQACGVAGNNIMDESTGEISWVDIGGNRHVYSGDAYQNRPTSCSKEPKILSSVEYKAIPEGPPMTKNDYCLTANINKDDYATLLDLNGQIMEVAKQLMAKSDMLAKNDETQQRDVEAERKRIMAKIQELDLEKMNINDRIDTVNSLNKESDDHRVERDMYHTTTLMYIFSSVLLGYMAIRLL